MNATKDRITFLVGAGLLQDAGLPTSVELVTKLKEALVANAASPEASEEERTPS